MRSPCESVRVCVVPLRDHGHCVDVAGFVDIFRVQQLGALVPRGAHLRDDGMCVCGVPSPHLKWRRGLTTASMSSSITLRAMPKSHTRTDSGLPSCERSGGEHSNQRVPIDQPTNLGNKDIGGLEVLMQHPLRVQRGHGVRHLTGARGCLYDPTPPAPLLRHRPYLAHDGKQQHGLDGGSALHRLGYEAGQVLIRLFHDDAYAHLSTHTGEERGSSTKTRM